MLDVVRYEADARTAAIAPSAQALIERGETVKHIFLAGACGLLVALALATAGSATVPGPNGLIVFRAVTDNGSQVFTIGPDGTDQRQLTHLPGDAFLPHWSPESNRIVFEFDPANPVNTTSATSPP
jgi:hypothetical protein